MTYQLNQKIKDLKPYEPISGTFKIRLDANECPCNYPEDIMQEIREAVAKIDFNRYPDPLATDVVNSFAEYYNISPQLVTAGNGSDELIFLAESAFLEKGDKMLVVSPDFSMYNFYSSICEVECASFFKDDSLKIDVDSLINKINSENIKLLIFSNPCNPTGIGINAQEARRLVSCVNSLVILDEAYMDFWSESLINEAENYSNLIIFRTASKSVGSAALRLGFAVANQTITQALKAVKSPYNVNSVSQTIGKIIYSHKDFLKERQKSIVSSREMLYNGLKDISKHVSDFKVYESVANFVFVKTACGKDLWEYLKSKSIAIRYMGEYIRITAGTQAETAKLIKAVNDYFKR